MKWTTRAHLHLDRTASAWLITRFIDDSAAFEFIGWHDEPDAGDPRAFGMHGVALSSHDEDGTCFEKLIRAHGLEGDQALTRLAGAVAAGVRHAFGIADAETDGDVARIGVTLDALGVGFGLQHVDDEAHLKAAAPAYDALYHFFQLPASGMSDLPATQPERINHLRSLVQGFSAA